MTDAGTSREGHLGVRAPAAHGSSLKGAPINLRRNMTSVFVANAAVPLAVFATAPVIAQVLGVSGRGEVAAATSLFGLLTALATLGLPEAVAYSVASRGAGARLVGRSVLLAAVTGAIVTVGTLPLAPVLAPGNPGIQGLIMLAGVGVVPSLIGGILRGAAQGEARWRLVNLDRYLSAFARLAGIGGLALLGALTPLSTVLVFVFAPLTGMLAYLPLAGRRHEGKREVVASRDLLGYGARVWLGSITGILLTRLDQAIMTPLAGTYELGLYAMAVNIADVLLISNSAVRDVIFSADAAARDDQRLYRAARVSLLIAIAIGAVVCGTVTLWLPPLFGAEFLPAVPAIVLLVAGAVVGIPGSIGGAALGARGRPGLRSISLVVAVVINAALLLALVGPLGAVGAAIATLVGNAVAANLNLIFLARTHGTRILPFYAVRPSDLRLIAGAIPRLRRTRGAE